ncbi:MAG: DNA integrity scanning diadenylate cyclase DisA [Actinomycetota bacterium]|nr:DNA integrity scanning diadenylate cyclase DisA [Actinomycetota bacterium]
MTEALTAVAPGKPLREGLDRILQANRGALIVVGDGPEVLEICSGGFLLDAEFSPQRLSELAKMDGAIILAPDTSRIARANVHLVPDPSVPTAETGTRHRTAERVARSLDVPVISVSEDLAIIAVYRNWTKHQLQAIPALVNRANQALQTLERYKVRLDTVTSSLSALEIEDLVTVRDVAAVLQRAEMVRRLAEEIDGYLVELGEDGRMLLLQLEELMGSVNDDRRLVARDYIRPMPPDEAASPVEMLAELPTEELLDLERVASVLGLVNEQGELDLSLQPHGYRLLSKIPRLPHSVIDRIVAHYGSLDRALAAAAEDDLEELEGVGEGPARVVREGLARLAEASMLERSP